MSIDKELKKVEKFIGSLKKTDVVELLWEKNGVKIGFKKDDDSVNNNSNAHVNKAQAVRGAEVSNSANAPELNDGNYMTVKSRMVGTFYLSPSPDSPVYVSAGDEVKSGGRICMIEAMKVMREITIDKDARIIKVLIENGHPVEYNQDMFLIEPLNKTK